MVSFWDFLALGNMEALTDTKASGELESLLVQKNAFKASAAELSMCPAYLSFAPQKTEGIITMWAFCGTLLYFPSFL